MASREKRESGESDERSRPRSRLWNALVVVVTLAVLLLVGEGVLRLFFPIAYSMDIEYIDDGHVGWRLRPDRVYRLAGGGTCTINNLGFRRAADTEVVKPARTRRVVVLGGSAVFCYEVDDSLTWTALLEKRLRAEYGGHVEVINAGVPGYDAFVSKINYLYRVRPIAPDIVIVSHTWNDLKRLQEVETGVLPDATIGPRPSRVRKFLRHFQLAWRVRSLYWRYLEGDRRENAAEWGGGEAAVIEPGGAGHRWVRRNFDDLALLLEADGVAPVFCSQAGLLSRDNVDDPDIRGAVRNDYAHLSIEETLGEWEALTRIIEASAWENGVAFVDVYDRVPHERRFFHDHVHLTEEGNRRVADAVFENMILDPAVDARLRGVPR